MGSRYRLIALFVLTLGATLVFVATGLPRTRLSSVLAESGAYTYSKSSGSSDNSHPACGGLDVSSTTLGKVIVTSPIFWEPKDGSTIGSLTVDVGQTFFIIQSDPTNQWYQIAISCSLVWVPAGAISP